MLKMKFKLSIFKWLNLFVVLCVIVEHVQGEMEPHINRPPLPSLPNPKTSKEEEKYLFNLFL
jgi:hypothetical protein